MAQKSLKELEEFVAHLRVKLADAEGELKSRKEAKLAKAAGQLARRDPAFAKALAEIMEKAPQKEGSILASKSGKSGGQNSPAKQ